MSDVWIAFERPKFKCHKLIIDYMERILSFCQRATPHTLITNSLATPLTLIANSLLAGLKCRRTAPPTVYITQCLEIWFFVTVTFRNDVTLTDSAECAVELEDDVCRLTIERPRIEDCGRYSCVAENEAGVANCTARINVKGNSIKR